MSQQEIVLKKDIENVNVVFVRIHSVYPGDTWPDLCISELSLSGTESDTEVADIDFEERQQEYDESLNLVKPQSLALNKTQIEQMSRMRYFVLTPAQKQSLSEVWDRDTLSAPPSNWYDCTCLMSYVDWTYKDSVYLHGYTMPSRVTINEDEGELDYGPFSSGLVMGIDGFLYDKGVPVDVSKLVEKQRAEKKNIPYDNAVECFYSQGISIDFPPEKVVGEKTIKQYKKSLKDAGLMFCEMNYQE